MARRVSNQLQSVGLLPLGQELPLETYAVARNVASEAGTGTIAEKVAIAEAAYHRAREAGRPMLSFMLKDGKYFGRQRGRNPAVATSRDPKWEDIAIASLVAQGKTDNFARGATHYFSPRAMDALHRKGRVDVDRWGLYERWTKSYGLAWVGPIPGINPHRQFLMREVPQESPLWQQQYEAGLRALQEPPPGEPPLCPPGVLGGDGLRVWAALNVGAAFVAGVGYVVARFWGR